MHFHLPKPLHGWREFAGEVGIIVIGVLIALAAGQVASEIHDRQVARDTHALVAGELRANLAPLVLRNSAEPCVRRRLQEIRTILGQWAQTGTFNRPSWIAQAPSFEAKFPVYDAAVASGRMALLPSTDQSRIGALVDSLREFNRIETDESEPWAKLRLLQNGPKVLTANDRTMMWEALESASTLDYRARLAVRQLLPAARSDGYSPDMSVFHRIAANIWKGGRFNPSICVDINTPPAEANRLAGQVVPLPD